MGSVRILSDEDVAALFDWDGAIAALRAAYGAPASEAMFPPRLMARGDGVWLRTLTGVMPGSPYMGAKMIAASPKARAASYLIPLFDQRTTALRALLAGNAVTGLRTAATSALAADLLAVPGPRRIAVIGSGFEARTHLKAVASLGGVEAVTVFSPRAASRAAFAAEFAGQPFAVAQAESAGQAVAGASLVLCAARSRDETPTFRGEWMRPGMTVISIGSTLPEQREIDPEAIARADLIVADMVDEVAHDTGDMIAAAREGVAFADKLTGLDALVSGAHPGRRSPGEIALYKSVGAAIQDLAVAGLCADRAEARGAGTTIPAFAPPIDKGK